MLLFGPQVQKFFWGRILYQIGRTHADESIYYQPEKFDPERFSPERSEDKKPFSYVHFGGGMRECLGKVFAQLVMKVFAVYLVRDYNWELLPEQNLELVKNTNTASERWFKGKFLAFVSFDNSVIVFPNCGLGN
ncbi:cytochrome P450 [Floridanema aerugineum]|uniref:Cytochrome P450 n=1 Tax=Floridaenema aerugineum BLCC-F46 TaxID=3153654 RepID=A0ABV4XEL8_9CYAN